MTVTASVVVCCYADERRAQVLAAVCSVQEQDPPPAEIVVVVDHNPGMMAWLRERLAGVVLVANAEQRGLTGARNTGVRASRGEVVAFLDDDAVAAAGWLPALLAEYVDPGVVAVGGRIDAAWVDGRPRWFPQEFDWVVGCSYLGQPTVRAEVRNVIGANMSFRRDVVVRVGGFRSELGRVGTLPAGCEETELCIRAVAATGGRVVHQPAAVVAHHVPGDRGTWTYFRSRCRAEGRSKAVVAALAGPRSALATERTYVVRVLPRGVARGLRDGLLARRTGGFGRAAAIVLGLALTSSGYLVGRVPATTAAPGARWHAGVWCCEYEMSGPGDVVAPTPWQGQPTARVLVRLHGEPLGHVTTAAAGGAVDVAEVTGLARAAYGERVDAHLAGNGAGASGTAGPVIGPARVGHPEAAELVTVVVCTRDRGHVLAECLRGLSALTHPRLEIIVVDNAPRDGTTAAVVAAAAAADDRIRYVVEPRPGLSRARNRGLAEARGAVVAYTDDDVVVDPDWVQGVLRGFGRRADVACVTGFIGTAAVTDTVEAYFDARASSWSTRFDRELFDMAAGRPPHALFPYTFSLFGAGANMAFDREFLLATGGFDEALGAGSPTRGGEDVDKFVSTLLGGRALAYEPSAIVWHRHRAEHRDLLRQMFGYGTGLTALLAKHLSAPQTRREVLRRILPGLAQAVRIRRDTSSALGPAVPTPRGAVLCEFLGHLAGPYLYVRARRRRDGRS